MTKHQIEMNITKIQKAKHGGTQTDINITKIDK